MMIDDMLLIIFSDAIYAAMPPFRARLRRAAPPLTATPLMPLRRHAGAHTRLMMLRHAASHTTHYAAAAAAAAAALRDILLYYARRRAATPLFHAMPRYATRRKMRSMITAMLRRRY